MDLNQNRLVIETTRTLDKLNPEFYLDALEELIATDPKLAESIFKIVLEKENKGFDIYLKNFTNKIYAIKFVRNLTSWGLGDSKTFIEGTNTPYNKPFLLFQNVSIETVKNVEKTNEENPNGINIEIVKHGSICDIHPKSVYSPNF